jgi:hypothetical protein
MKMDRTLMVVPSRIEVSIHDWRGHTNKKMARARDGERWLCSFSMGTSSSDISGMPYRLRQ